MAFPFSVSLPAAQLTETASLGDQITGSIMTGNGMYQKGVGLQATKAMPQRETRSLCGESLVVSIERVHVEQEHSMCCSELRRRSICVALLGHVNTPGYAVEERIVPH